MSEFDKIIGYEDIKAELKRLCDVLRNPQRYEILGVSMPNGILLCGEPGIGKTLMAKCFIAESGCKAFTLRKEMPNGDFVKEIKSTFEKAKAEAPAIVFLDDMDKFANEDRLHPDAEEYVTVQSCIDDCKGQKVFTLATANDTSCLPESLLRAGRFDKIISVMFPLGKESRQIIEHYLKAKSVVGNIDIEEIARIMENHTCAEIEMIINDAGIYAGYEGRDKINREDLIKSCMRVLFEAPECVDQEDDPMIKHKALHEAGHAVIAEILHPGLVSLISIYKHEGLRGGLTKYKDAGGEYYILTKKMQEHNAIMSLGGKAATEMVLGETDMGCKEDLDYAFCTVFRFVDMNCDYGFDAHLLGDCSGRLLENRDRLVAYEVSRLYKQAKKMLAENRKLLDAITEALIEKKILTYRDIQKIKADIDSAA